MNDTIPAAKIEMLEGSMRCFTFGLLGLLPIIGIPFAVAALVVSGRVRVYQKRFWNPARPYWIVGRYCAVAGIAVGVGLLAVIIGCMLFPTAFDTDSRLTL